MDGGELKDLKKSEGIPDYPTFRIYKASQKVDELVGASNKMLEDLIKKNTGYLISFCYLYCQAFLLEIETANEIKLLYLKM